MSSFGSYLEEVNRRLGLPQPAKSRILLEIAADLRDLYELYRSRGLGEEEAEQRALEKIRLSDEAMGQLVRIHESPFRRWLAGLSGSSQSRLERAAFAAVLLFVLVMTGREVVAAPFLRAAGPFIWPILAFAAGAAAIALARAYALFVKKDHHIKRIRSGLDALLALSAASVLTAVFGLLLELYRSFGRSVSDVERTLLYSSDWLLRSSALITAGLLVAILVCIIWFLLYRKVVRIEQAEVGFLWEL